MSEEAQIRYPIPTGYLFVDDYSKGKLETLSIGDYGKSVNVKADFLGYSDDLNGVPNTWCMPLSEKWVVTLSTQYGCPMRCTFCDVPNVPMRGNVTVGDLSQQLVSALRLFDGVGYTERLNIHFARMGDPIFNAAVFEFSRNQLRDKEWLRREAGLRVEVVHPVLTTSLPKAFKYLEARILEWCEIKNEVFHGQAGLQFSINSTSEAQRNEMFAGMQLGLDDLARIAERMPDPVSRKYCLNFAYSTDFEVDAKIIADRFDPEKFMCKITPIHNNNACRENGIETVEGYESFRPYEQPESDLKAAGFDVLVFVPSIDEEDGLVTCGNAVLGGSQMKADPSVIKIKGLLR